MTSNKEDLHIYFPMTCNILTPGHIMCLDYLKDMGKVMIGLLSPTALLGYKREIVPYEDRLFVLEAVIRSMSNIVIVKQDNLDPSVNIKKYKPNAIASGDKWERGEIAAIEKFDLIQINIHLPGEEKKKYSASKIKL